MALHVDTPLVESLALTRPAKSRIFLKMDALQPPGSFKIRGIGHACEEHVRSGASRFVSSSGGNAGLAVAYAGQRLGVPVLVIVPETASERAKHLLQMHGASVRVHGKSWQEANALAQQLVTPEDAFLHPFDDPLLWAGHATLVDEVVAQGLRPDAVVLSVGGGGLLSGVVEGLRKHGLESVPVIAVETTGAASYHAALQQGAPCELEAITSIATSLGAKQVSQHAFELSRLHPIRSALVSDAEAVEACVRFLDDHRVLVEPACGAALAIPYLHPELLSDFGNVLVVVCGGATATLEQLQRWHAQR